MENRQLYPITVTPHDLEIYEANFDITEKNVFLLLPTFYICRIAISPRVIKMMLEWLIRNHYIEYDGIFHIKIRGKVGRTYGKSKGKKTKKINGTSG